MSPKRCCAGIPLAFYRLMGEQRVEFRPARFQPALSLAVGDARQIEVWQATRDDPALDRFVDLVREELSVPRRPSGIRQSRRRVEP
ncbi:hypothetical protein P3T23_003453 [Paraburkholderia sp. GAS448]|jgi:hypothetical protein|uniref:hypothetical protein n=1 Tax=Paraburkholderia sp. GAS448 TaxID=3035136 RepID=UPI003D1E873F